MGFTIDDVKIIVSTFFSALMGVTIGNALTCTGDGCYAADIRDVIIAGVSIAAFLLIYYTIARIDRKHRPR